MAALLPLLAYLLLVLVFLARGDAPRRACLMAAVGWGGLVVLTTECLSLLGALSGVSLMLAWTAILLGMGGLLAGVLGHGRADGSPVDRLTESVSAAFSDPLTGGLNAGSVLLMGGVLLVAVTGAPNNGDSMSYHLPRVMHWIQNGSLAHYPTWIPRQLYQPPMAEFAVMHFQLLYGSDRLAALVQWFCLAGSGLVASLIAARLGAGTAGQVLAGLFVFTLPMGLLQGMTTQNDLVLSFWLAGGAFFCLEAFDRPRRRIAWGSVGPLALCLGLAVLTKGTGYPFGLPLLGATVLLAFYRHRGRGLRVLLVCLVVVLLLNGGHYARNIAAFGHPLVPPDRPFPYLNRALTPATVASNVIRNLALQAATPFEAMNGAIVHTVETLHDGLGLSVSDPRVTWRYSRFRIEGSLLNENHASNPLHLILVAGAFLVTTVKPRGSRGAVRRGLMGGVLAGFLAFCAVLQWQPWHVRLHLPLFVVSAPLVGTWMEESLRPAGFGLLAALLVGVGGWVVSLNRSHPLVGGPGNLFRTPRQSQYFTNRPRLEGPFREVARRIRRRSFRRVGLIVGLEEWVYPLWVLLSAGDGPEIVHVPPPEGTGVPGYFPGGSPSVRGIVCTVPDCEAWMRMKDPAWTLRWSRGDLQWWTRLRAGSDPGAAGKH